ncbi:ImmA/IrrE family metallo-endopeptidase [Natronincola ferrireducens]|uniref:IrrE N-terminal-like domain-containing protein n=1 Tax=Natronincola ferrireducens TaxID=393762 RepID=A0A1G9I2X0_9FIRM|nr:ImmA/IrrE family metallo-endopeptidase [Natronincola ferrireducens]SDL19163.1 protein of unknown function [Natronincola ferrireducens]
MEIKTIVNRLVEKYQTKDPFVLASCLNISTNLWPLHENIQGLYQNFKRNKFIFINDNLLYEQQKIVLAHEIGHAVLHKGLNVCFLEANTFFIKNKFETEANRFAVELLITDEMIYRFEGYTVEQIATAMEIDVNMLKLKL